MRKRNYEMSKTKWDNISGCVSKRAFTIEDFTDSFYGQCGHCIEFINTKERERYDGSKDVSIVCGKCTLYQKKLCEFGGQEPINDVAYWKLANMIEDNEGIERGKPYNKRDREKIRRWVKQICKAIEEDNLSWRR